MAMEEGGGFGGGANATTPKREGDLSTMQWSHSTFMLSSQVKVFFSSCIIEAKLFGSASVSYSIIIVPWISFRLIVHGNFIEK